MSSAPPPTHSGGLAAWLTSETPHSRGHAKCVQLYLGWLSLARNPLAMLGSTLIGFVGGLIPGLTNCLLEYSGIQC